MTDRPTVEENLTDLSTYISSLWVKRRLSMSSEGPYSRHGAGAGSAGYSSAHTRGSYNGAAPGYGQGYGGYGNASYSAPSPGEYGQQQLGFNHNQSTVTDENFASSPNQVRLHYCP